MYMLIILAILLFLSAYFSSAETALTTVSSISLRAMADEGDKKALLVLKILDNKQKMLSTILIGNNIVNIAASSITTIFAGKYFGSFAVSIAAGILTILVLIFGEITPKTMASYNALKLSLKYAKTIYFLMIVLTPIIYIVNFLSGTVLKILNVSKAKDLSITETELRTIVNVSHEEGVIEKEERIMINNVFDFGDAIASDIMIPRVDMTMADENSTYEELIELFKKERYTRIPIYHDNSDNIIGIVNVKDLLLYNPETNFDINNFLREPFFTYETKKISELMLEMKNSSVNLSIVLDEYGATAGLVTLEDMLEEIVGEIKDEYDTEEDEEIKEISPGKYVINGHTKISDVNDKLETNLHSDNYDSIGGLVIEGLDRFPNTGDKIIIDNIIIKVIKMNNRKIEKVELHL